jgi:hypothetical protein
MFLIPTFTIQNGHDVIVETIITCMNDKIDKS